MRSEAYYNKNKRKKKNLTYHLYDILDPLTKILVKSKSFFRKNPFTYISFKILFGILAIILPLILVCNNSYNFLTHKKDENKNYYEIPIMNINYNYSNEHINDNNYLGNLTEISKNKSTSEDYYSDFPNFNQANITVTRKVIKTSRKIFNVNLTNTSNQIKNDKNFIKNYKNQFLKLNNITESNQGNNSDLLFIKNEIDLLIPFKFSVVLLILMLVGFILNKLYYVFFVNK
jgi:hypothetical protein